MIPKNITREHILRAIQAAKAEGVPPDRASTKYDLIFEGEAYPPKYLISLANTWANGEELDAAIFDASMARLFLLDLGFETRRKSQGQRR